MSEISYIHTIPISLKVEKAGEEPISRPPHEAPIGIFDSGVGGLTVLKEVIKKLPLENVIYLGDTARIPFGSKTRDEIVNINREIFSFMKIHKVKMVMVACGTSSSIAIDEMRTRYRFPIIDIVGPAGLAASHATRNHKVGVIATEGAVKAGTFEKKIKLSGTQIEVFAQGCPLFVPLIEGGFLETDETKRVAQEYLSPLIKKEVDTLILGCTHYPHLTKIIREIVGPKVSLINPAEAAVTAAKETLNKMKIAKETQESASYKYYVTGTPLHFQELGSKLLSRQIMGTKKVTLGG